MNQESINYAKVLYDLSVPYEKLEKLKQTIEAVPQLKQMFLNPIIPKEAKFHVMERIFTGTVLSVMKVVLIHQDMDLIEEILTACKEYYHEKNGILDAVLYYVEKPDEEQAKGMKEYLKERFQKKQVNLEQVFEPELLGGFILTAGNIEYDWSYRGRLNRMKQKLAGR